MKSLSLLTLIVLAQLPAQELPLPIRGASWYQSQDWGAAAKLDAEARRFLAQRGARALPALLHRERPKSASEAESLATLFDHAATFPVKSLRLEDATLQEACAALSAITGVKVSATGAARRPITVIEEESSFWRCVLAICRAGEIGIAPLQEPHRIMNTQADPAAPWLPGTTSRIWAVDLGPQHELPDAIFAEGPMLIRLDAHAIEGERAVLLRVRARYVPDLPILGMTAPRFIEGIDGES